jgi:hypothetical protein
MKDTRSKDGSGKGLKHTVRRTGLWFARNSKENRKDQRKDRLTA